MTLHYITLLFQLLEKKMSENDCICKVKWAAKQTKRNKEKNGWQTLLHIIPPFMENISPVVVNVDIAQKQPENVGQVMVCPIPLNDDFCIDCQQLS